MSLHTQGICFGEKRPFTHKGYTDLHCIFGSKLEPKLFGYQISFMFLRRKKTAYRFGKTWRWV